MGNTMKIVKFTALLNFCKHFTSKVIIRVLIITSISTTALAKDLPIFIGSYSSQHGGKGEGIYMLKYDSVTGLLEKSNQMVVYPNTSTDNPSYMVINNKKIYVVEEVPSGHVVGYNISPDTYALTKINSMSLSGSNPAYLTYFDNHLLVANYGDGNAAKSGVSLLSIDASGDILKENQKIIYEGHGKDSSRQSASHTHSVYSINGINNQKLIFVVDLGLDKVFVYNFDKQQNKLILKHENLIEDSNNKSIATGPRHLAFSTDKTHIYIANELSSDIFVYDLNQKTGAFTFKQKIVSYMGKLKEERNYPSAINIAPNGKYLYVSNRGQDTIAQFQINKTNGKLKYITEYSTKGSWPRDFDISANGEYLVAGNQKSDTIIFFKINKTTGALENPQIRDVPTPVVVKFANF